MFAKIDTKVISKLYDLGAYTFKQIFDFVKQKRINKDQFHSITSCDYDGVKELKGW